MGPKEPRSTVLSIEEEAIAVAFRKHTLLPLDDCLYALQATIPHLTRSSLHRCYQRHGISRLPEVEGDKPAKKAFKKYPIGYFHIDIAEVRTEEGKLYLFVAVDRTSKFAFAQLHDKAGKLVAAQFLRDLADAVPYKIHTVLTDNGIQFVNRKRDSNAFEHIFVRTCRDSSIEHRLTKINHPWTNGQVERMNRTLKEATVRRYHYDSHDQLREHLAAFLAAYNFAKRLKTLRGLTPHEYICKCWTENPDQFRLNPLHHMPGLNTYGSGPNLDWLVSEKEIAPHIPVIDKSNREDGTFSRKDFRYDAERDCYVCPAGCDLTTTGRLYNDDLLAYRASVYDRRRCPLKPKCCPKASHRKVLRSLYEEARDVARATTASEAYAQTRRDRKKVEMLFAHLKRILRLARLRLRGPSGAQFEFTLAAIAQNLRRLAKLTAQPPPAAALACVA